MKIELPRKVIMIINNLQLHGYEAFAVGGCVRDSILARRPQDWDPTLADEYDDEYDAMVLHAAKGRPMDYSILTKEAETVIREAEEEEKEEAPPEFVGEEEEIDLGEDDDEE